MAKHPHKLILLNKKTWRCTIEGCGFFVHLGLAHVLKGKSGICWKCNEEYTITEQALKEEMPVCDECRAGNRGMSLVDMEDIINAKLSIARAGFKRASDMPQQKRQSLISMGVLKERALKHILDTEKEEELEAPPTKNETESDEVESDYVHTSDCEIYTTGECTCS